MYYYLGIAGLPKKGKLGFFIYSFKPLTKRRIPNRGIRKAMVPYLYFYLGVAGLPKKGKLGFFI